MTRAGMAAVRERAARLARRRDDGVKESQRRRTHPWRLTTGPVVTPHEHPALPAPSTRVVTR
jgi:hypothetical protein